MPQRVLWMVFKGLQPSEILCKLFNMCGVFFPLEQWSTFLLTFKGVCVPLPGPLTSKLSYPSTSVPGP